MSQRPGKAPSCHAEASLEEKRPPGHPESGTALIGQRRAITVTVPIRTVNELNSHTHWRVRQKRAQEQHRVVGFHLLATGRPPALPVTVTLTRVSYGTCDEGDGLPATMKHVRDCVARWLGCGDSPRDPITWRYGQERGPIKYFAVRIEIDSCPK